MSVDFSFVEDVIVVTLVRWRCRETRGAEARWEQAE